MKLFYQKAFLLIAIITSLTNSVFSQNVGIGTESPEAKLHVSGAGSNDSEVYVDFENSNASPLIQTGSWFFNEVSYAGNLSTNSGYETSGSKMMSYSVVVPADQYAILSYALKNELGNDGQLTLPFENPIVGNGGNSEWQLKSVNIPEGTYNLEWIQEAIVSGNFIGRIYVDEVRIQFYTANHLLRVESLEKVVIDAGGNVGIGTETPGSKLDIQGSIDNSIGLLRSRVNYQGFSDVRAVEGHSVTGPGYGIGGYFTGGYYAVRAINTGQDYPGSSYGILASSSGTNQTGTRYGIRTSASGGATNWAGYFAAGNVFVQNDLRIGTNSDPYAGTYKVIVDGKILSEEVRIQNSNNWADYVFADDYQLRSLEEVENHINQNHHLPGVPSAKVVESEGILVGDMQRLLMEKIEELTLYLIDQEKRLIHQQHQISELNRKL